jgi:hypothetical protein
VRAKRNFVAVWALVISRCPRCLPPLTIAPGRWPPPSPPLAKAREVRGACLSSAMVALASTGSNDMLIRCNECGSQFGDQHRACPYCGHEGWKSLRGSFGGGGAGCLRGRWGGLPAGEVGRVACEAAMRSRQFPRGMGRAIQSGLAGTLGRTGEALATTGTAGSRRGCR